MPIFVALLSDNICSAELCRIRYRQDDIVDMSIVEVSTISSRIYSVKTYCENCYNKQLGDLEFGMSGIDILARAKLMPI